MELIFTNHPEACVMLQSMAADSYGQDLRVFVVDGQVVGCIKRCASRGFKTNVSKGDRVSAYPLNHQIGYLATESAQLFGLPIAGIDLLFHRGGYQICDVNSAPGFEGFEQVVGQCIAEKIIQSLPMKIVSHRSISQSLGQTELEMVHAAETS